MSEVNDAETPEIEAEAEVEELQGGESEESEKSETKEDKPSESSAEKDSVQKRINELTWKYRETERQLAETARLNREMSEQLARLNNPIQPGKTLEDFDYDESKYQTYLRQQITEQAVQEARKAMQEEQNRASEFTKRQQFEGKERDFMNQDGHDDYYDVTRSMPLTKEMYEATVDMPNGPSVLYYLGKNPDMAALIAGLPPIQAAVEMGKVQSKLSVEKAKSPKAPPPPSKIEGADPGTKVKASVPESDKLSMEEWLKRRNKELANR